MRSPREETQEVILRLLVCTVNPRHILDVMIGVHSAVQTVQSRQKRLSTRTQVGARPGCACETSDAVSFMRSEIARIPLRRLSLTWCRRSRGATPLRVTVLSVERSGSEGFLRRDQPLPTFRSRSPCASWAPPRSGVSAGKATGLPRTAPFCP